MAARTRYLLASLAMQATGPADLFNRANDQLAALLPYDRFLSAAACRVRPSAGRLTVALAGHPFPVLLREGGRVEELQMPPRPPLGAFAGTFYAEAEFHLDKSDVLLLYTDGITEARRGEEFFGVEGIARVWSQTRQGDLGALARAICSAAAAFHDRPDAQDDRLALLAKITPSAVSLLPEPDVVDVTMAARS